MLCTILEVPLGSFLSTLNHDHLPSCSSFWHKCKESNGLILPWLRFASKSLLQIFIKVSSLVELVAELLLLSISWHTCIGFRGSNATTRVFIIRLPHAIHLTYHHVFYVKPSMSQTPKLRFDVFESISSVMNIRPRVMIV